jgi:hypothetical protein
MKFMVSFSSLVLLSLTNIAPCFAANRSLAQLANQSLSSQIFPTEANSFQVAGLFDVIKTVDTVVDTVDRYGKRAKQRAAAQQRQEKRQLQKLARIQKQKDREMEIQAAIVQRRQYLENLSPEERQVYLIEQQAKQQQQLDAIADVFLNILTGESSVSQEKAPQPLPNTAPATTEKSVQPLIQDSANPTQNRPQITNNRLHQILNKRANETHEQWYKRTTPIIMNTPGAEYRAWKATLSVQDRKAYDAITRQNNRAAADRFDKILPAIIQDAASSQDAANRPRECWFTHPTYGRFRGMC